MRTFEPFLCSCAFVWRCFFGTLTLPLEVIYYREPQFFIDYFRGLWAGWQYIHLGVYKSMPAFDTY